MIIKNNIMTRFFLPFLERFLRTDVRYLLKGTFWLSISRVLGMGVAFGLSVLYARYLPKELYGNFRYIMSIAGALGIFALPGMATIIMRSVARGFEGTFRRGSLLIFFASFGISVISIGIAVWFYAHGNSAFAAGFLITGLLVPFAEGLGNWRAYFDGRKEFQKKTGFNIVSNLFYGIVMGSTIALIIAFDTDSFAALVFLVAAYFLGHGIPNIIAYRSTLRIISKQAPIEPGAIRYGFHLSFLEAPATIANYLDGVLLYQLLGPASLAVYSFALAPTEQMKGFLGLSATVAAPKLFVRTATREETAELKRTLTFKILRSVFFTAFLVGFYIMLAPWFYRTFFPAYQEAILFSQILSLSLLLFPLGLFNTALKAEGDLRKIYIYQLCAPFVQIIAFAILIPLFGIWGAVIGRLFGRFVTYFLALFLFIWP
jgi:O-antigen/teichoic acid export membrane protein